jgi:hypothetical protein
MKRKEKASDASMPALEGIREVKTSSFRKFRPETGWEVYVLVFIFRGDGSIDRHEMSQADYLKFQEARGALIAEWRPPDAA